MAKKIHTKTFSIWFLVILGLAGLIVGFIGGVYYKSTQTSYSTTFTHIGSPQILPCGCPAMIVGSKAITCKC